MDIPNYVGLSWRVDQTFGEQTLGQLEGWPRSGQPGCQQTPSERDSWGRDGASGFPGEKELWLDLLLFFKGLPVLFFIGFLEGERR